MRLWKWELQQLANRTRLAITVCHFPPGTSKWNKIEHRLFSYISTNWRGQPLVSLAVIVSRTHSPGTPDGSCMIGESSELGLTAGFGCEHGGPPGDPGTSAPAHTVGTASH